MAEHTAIDLEPLATPRPRGLRKRSPQPTKRTLRLPSKVPEWRDEPATALDPFGPVSQRDAASPAQGRRLGDARPPTGAGRCS